jgi:peptidoglycan glycosyltransferase
LAIQNSKLNTQHWKTVAAWGGLALGLALLAGGLLLADESLWRLLLLTSLWLFSLLPRAYLRRRPTVPNQPIERLALVVGLCFAGVGLQLVREQGSQAGALRQRAGALLNPTAVVAGAAADNGIPPADRTSVGSGIAWAASGSASAPARGRILDRAGVVLAETRDGRRVYSDQHTAPVVGFQSRLYGTAGIEHSFDDYLSGARSVSATQLLAASQLGLAIDAMPADVQLTIDSRLQQVADEALGDRVGAVVLIDPHTGAILALATAPRFDPNQLVLPSPASDADVAAAQAAWQALSGRADSPLLNRAAQGRYPPGSVIKTFTAAAALDSGVLAGPEAQVTCPNQLATEAGAPPVVNAVPNLASRTGDPSDLRRVFAFSCNTAFAQIGLALGPERFGQYAQRFGMGYADAPLPPALTDIAADSGTIAGSASFLQRPAALADTAFGQGQALITPLDMAQMAAVVANDGTLMRPYLVQSARAGDTQLYEARPTPLRPVISAQAAQKMRDIMRTSVEIGYAKPVALPGVSIGAKTGTAETPTGDPHSWFVAIAPVEQPRFALAVIVENGGEGSRSALPVARQVLAAALGVQP